MYDAENYGEIPRQFFNIQYSSASDTRSDATHSHTCFEKNKEENDCSSHFGLAEMLLLYLLFTQFIE